MSLSQWSLIAFGFDLSIFINERRVIDIQLKRFYTDVFKVSLPTESVLFFSMLSETDAIVIRMSSIRYHENQ